MNELMELGLVAKTPAPNRDTPQDNELTELGLVVSETKGHCHGSLPDPGASGACKTTSPPC